MPAHQAQSLFLILLPLLVHAGKQHENLKSTNERCEELHERAEGAEDQYRVLPEGSREAGTDEICGQAEISGGREL